MSKIFILEQFDFIYFTFNLVRYRIEKKLHKFSFGVRYIKLVKTLDDSEMEIFPLFIALEYMTILKSFSQIQISVVMYLDYFEYKHLKTYSKPYRYWSVKCYEITDSKYLYILIVDDFSHGG